MNAENPPVSFQFTNLAALVRRAFEKLPVGQGAEKRPMVEVWRRSLGLDDSNSRFFDVMLSLSRNLDRLGFQVDALSDLEERNSKRLQGKILSLKSALDPARLSIPFAQHVPNISGDVLDWLDMIGELVRKRFPEAIPTPEDIDGIVNTISDIEKTITASNIPPFLKITLLEQVNFLLWIVKNVDSLGVGLMSEAALQAMTSIRREADNVPSAEKKKIAGAFQELQAVWKAGERLIWYTRHSSQDLKIEYRSGDGVDDIVPRWLETEKSERS